MSSRPFYCGLRQKLVLAFDVGTTYSGISYSVLDPGHVPEIKGVTRFLDQEHIMSGTSKIPTIIYYDQKGQVRAVGAEATKDGVFEVAEEEHWVKAEWFKLHFASKIGDGNSVDLNKIPPLPLYKTVVDVFADFLKYLLECASSYIQDTYSNGGDLWSSVKDDIHFVLSHPNGWEGRQQADMRKATILANLISDDAAGCARLSFVTEGEASLHFAIQNGLLRDSIDGGGILIVDAGGGTIDVSSYGRNVSSEVQTFEEIATPKCYFCGSVFVSVNAQLYLSKLLADSTFIDDVEHMTRCFDRMTKLRFRSAEEQQFIKFGSTRDNDSKYNINFGQIKLQGSDVAMFFGPSLECIIRAIEEQMKTAHKKISHVIVTGGFAASNWLYSKIADRLLGKGLNIFRPENQVNKAVSDGAVSFYLNHFVRTRLSKITYGVAVKQRYKPKLSEHLQRESQTFIDPCGERALRGGFDMIMPKNTRVTGTKEFRKTYTYLGETKSDLQKHLSHSILSYHGLVSNPIWKDDDPVNYKFVCSISIDLSSLPWYLRQKPSGIGTYVAVFYDIVLLFGLTEFQAQLAWKEGYVERRTPATIIYDVE